MSAEGAQTSTSYICDFVVIGGGIAGAAAAYQLAQHGKVLVVERESQPGYHSTGRSAALYEELYGVPTVRRLTQASQRFLQEPPIGFADHALLRPRGALYLATDDPEPAACLAEEAAALGMSVELWSWDKATTLVELLRPRPLGRAVWVPNACDIEVHALHHGFLKGIKRQGALWTGVEVRHIRREAAGWSIESSHGSIRAAYLINAAGAWADEVAVMAGVAPLGHVPRRRTAVTVAAPLGANVARWPHVENLDGSLYVKPDAGLLLVSPNDETDTEPCDCQPEELDVAIAIDRLEQLMTLEVRRVEHRWAGLRTFARDASPVAGFKDDERFFWLTGQGGFGIMTSPALSQCCADLLVSGDLRQELLDVGLRSEDLAPARLNAGGEPGPIRANAT